MSKLEFFVALALVALAQSGRGQSYFLNDQQSVVARAIIAQRVAMACSRDMTTLFMKGYGDRLTCRADLSVERVAALAQENNLPVPSLDLSSLVTSTSSFGHYPNIVADIRAPVPTRAYTSDDPWSVSKVPTATPVPNGGGSLVNGSSSSISGTGLPKDWWRKQETITVNILGQQGFILNRYLVYEVATDVRDPRSLPSDINIDDLSTALTSGTPTLFGVRGSMGLLGSTVSVQITSTTTT